MINSKYSRAYTEVIEIIKFFPQTEYEKIPKEKIEFYKNNMDKNYVFTINPENLLEQHISLEANAIIVNLFTNYIATTEQKLKIKKILDLNQQKEEQEKRKKYNPDDLFKNKPNHKIIENNTKVTLIENKESLFIKFKNFILKILHITQ